jgi:thiol:disulfide interchange protein
LLAAFVATPCTGPFMASAMGAALLLPPVAALALFATLGLGIALPFLAIAYVPALRGLLPRPGAWMGWFRKAMALPLGLTALALAWLAGRLGGDSFALAGIALAAALVVVLAWLGLGQRRGKAMARPVGVALLVLAVVAGVALPRSLQAPDASQLGAAEVLPSQPFSAEALAAARASGHPAFAFFTADWCLTCKVNERLAIERDSTRAAFARAGVVVLKGDWTRRDPAITRYLGAMGAAGVPLYVWYPAGGGEPRQLPQILTPALLTALPETQPH